MPSTTYSSRHYPQQTYAFFAVIRVYLIIFLINHNQTSVNGVQLLLPEISTTSDITQYLRDMLGNKIDLYEKSSWQPLHGLWGIGGGRNETVLNQRGTLNDYPIPKTIDIAPTNSKWKTRNGVNNAAILDYMYQLLNLKKNAYNSESSNIVLDDNKPLSWDGNTIRGTWFKRVPNWNNLKGMWGKRVSKDWQKLQGGWGKRFQDEMN